MNKNKKRHISKAKFERIERNEYAILADFDVSPQRVSYYTDEAHYFAVASGDFLYWELIRTDGTKEYYRKALSEVFK